MPCLTKVKFPGLTKPATFDALSGVMMSPGLTWAAAGIAVEIIAITNASVASVEYRFGFICGVLIGEQTCTNSARGALCSRRRPIAFSYPRRREKWSHRVRDPCGRRGWRLRALF